MIEAKKATYIVTYKQDANVLRKESYRIGIGSIKTKSISLY